MPFTLHNAAFEATVNVLACYHCIMDILNWAFVMIDDLTKVDVIQSGCPVMVSVVVRRFFII